MIASIEPVWITHHVVMSDFDIQWEELLRQAELQAEHEREVERLRQRTERRGRFHTGSPPRRRLNVSLAHPWDRP